MLTSVREMFTSPIMVRSLIAALLVGLTWCTGASR